MYTRFTSAKFNPLQTQCLNGLVLISGIFSVKRMRIFNSLALDGTVIHRRLSFTGLLWMRVESVTLAE